MNTTLTINTSSEVLPGRTVTNPEKKRTPSNFQFQADLHSVTSVLSSSSLPNRQTMTPKTRKHYSDNLYAVLDDGYVSRRKHTRSTIGRTNPLLNSLERAQKMLITKQALRTCKDRRMEREVRFSIQNADENLDEEDPFQSEGFSLNIEDSNVIEFNFQEVDEFDFTREPEKNCGKLSENLEHYFNDKAFEVVLTEGERKRTIANVKLVDGNYCIYDIEGNYLFQIEKVSHPSNKQQLVIAKRNSKGKVETEMGTLIFGSCKILTLEVDVFFEEVCSPKEKVMILATVCTLMMKIQMKGRQQRENGGACSVKSLWKDIFGSLF